MPFQQYQALFTAINFRSSHLLREYDWVYLTFEKLALFEMKSVNYQKAQIKIEC